MLYRFGRGLQLVGMVILPVGMAGNIVRPELISVQESLICAGLGLAVFAAGWLLQQLSRRA